MPIKSYVIFWNKCDINILISIPILLQLNITPVICKKIIAYNNTTEFDNLMSTCEMLHPTSYSVGKLFIY